MSLTNKCFFFLHCVVMLKLFQYEEKTFQGDRLLLLCRSWGQMNTLGNNATLQPRMCWPKVLRSGSPSMWLKQCENGWWTEVRLGQLIRVIIPCRSQTLNRVNLRVTFLSRTQLINLFSMIVCHQELIWVWRSVCTVPATPSAKMVTSLMRTRCWKWSLKVRLHFIPTGVRRSLDLMSSYRLTITEFSPYVFVLTKSSIFKMSLCWEWTVACLNLCLKCLRINVYVCLSFFLFLSLW